MPGMHKALGSILSTVDVKIIQLRLQIRAKSHRQNLGVMCDGQLDPFG